MVTNVDLSVGQAVTLGSYDDEDAVYSTFPTKGEGRIEDKEAEAWGRKSFSSD
jgi:hypothetical protein